MHGFRACTSRFVTTPDTTLGEPHAPRHVEDTAAIRVRTSSQRGIDVRKNRSDPTRGKMAV
jgi:hypothetical protein